jgi:hypothetical protein
MTRRWQDKMGPRHDFKRQTADGKQKSSCKDNTAKERKMRKVTGHALVLFELHQHAFKVSRRTNPIHLGYDRPSLQPVVTFRSFSTAQKWVRTSGQGWISFLNLESWASVRPQGRVNIPCWRA